MESDLFFGLKQSLIALTWHLGMKAAFQAKYMNMKCVRIYIMMIFFFFINICREVLFYFKYTLHAILKVSKMTLPNKIAPI